MTPNLYADDVPDTCEFADELRLVLPRRCQRSWHTNGTEVPEGDDAEDYCPGWVYPPMPDWWRGRTGSFNTFGDAWKLHLHDTWRTMGILGVSDDT